MKLVLLPAGRFEMGARGTESFRSDHSNFDVQDARRRHQVVLTKPFRLATTEVTRGQFRAFVEATGYKTTAEQNGLGIVGWDTTPSEDRPKDLNSFRQKPEFDWESPGFDQEDDHCVVGVSYRDAQEFCRWLSQKEGRTYRLPTEAEWEYAARAGTETYFSFGDQYQQTIHQHANIGNVELEKAAPGRVMRQWLVDVQRDPDDGYVFTSPASSYPANAWGLHDMHGNAWEWCEDRYLDTFYDQFKADGHQRLRKRAIDPMNLESWTQHGDYRSIRGGSWFTSPIQARSAVRGYFESSDAACYVGFRVACDAAEDIAAVARERFTRSEQARDRMVELTRELRERRAGVLAIVVRHKHLTDEFFEELAALDEPVDLEVDGSGRLTGDDVARLCQARDLRGLTLSGTGPGLKDDDFAVLAQHPRISRLQITGAVKLSDALFDHFGKLLELQSLIVQGEGITDKGFEKLPALTQMRTLRFGATQATGAVLAKLKGSPLDTLECHHFQDEQFELLTRFADWMQDLDLRGSPITDEGLDANPFASSIKNIDTQ